MRLIHTNDLHGALTPELVEFARPLIPEGALFVDTGDAIKAGNLGVPVRVERAWKLLSELGVKAGTIGNRETHLLESAFQAKIAGHSHILLCANMRRRVDGSHPLPATHLCAVAGLRVGILGVSVAMITDQMTARLASAFVWDDPLKVAAEQAEQLRPRVDVVIALTHIGYKLDFALAHQGLGIDIIFGGHSHSVLPAPERVNSTWIAQGGSHARYLGVYEWDGALRGGLQPWKLALQAGSAAG